MKNHQPRPEKISALKMAASATTSLLDEAQAFHRKGAVAEATLRYREVLRIDPGNADAHYYLGMISCRDGRFDEGAWFARQSMANDPQHAPAHVLLGRALAALGHHGEALASFDAAVSINPGLAQAHSHYADLLSDLGRNIEALEHYNRAVELAPHVIEDWFNRGQTLVAMRQLDDAIASFDRAISVEPNFIQAHLARAKALSAAGRHAQALEGIDRVLAFEAASAEAWLARGNVLSELKRYRDALAAFQRALVVKPELTGAWLGCGNIFCKLKRHSEGFAAYDKALALKPDLVEALVARGNALLGLKRYDEAFVAYDKAFALKPDLAWLEGFRLHTKMHVCDWNNFAGERAHLVSSVRDQRESTDPFAFLAVSSSPGDQMACAKLWAARLYPTPKKAVWHGERYTHDRIRVAYLSADFRDHPVSYLMAGVFEHHDRQRFETVAVSFGPDDAGEMRTRLKAAFDRFIDVNDQSDADVAALLHRLEIDIAVDLMGFTTDARTEILAMRTAPIQVGYLGYAGTMGADYIDYLVADRILVPPEHRAHYAEKIAFLPNSYQPHDSKRPFSDRLFDRAEFGLPQDGFVFCCFNNSYKLNPDIFDCWMRILKAVDGSVLWLSEMNPAATANLKKEAAARGVAPVRLIFTRRLPFAADHIARHRLADLFLDTLPFNAHTTASDALWAGLPVLAQIGETMAGRVTASLLTAVGLAELITGSWQEYEATAIGLAQQPARLVAIKQRLAQNRATAPLFDTPLFTRRIERAYELMYRRQQAGLLADDLHVAEDACR